MLRIDYESEKFPVPGPVANGLCELTTSWDELLWAAITVGRPNRNYVFRHGDTSIYEAIFRWSAIRMALEQAGPRAFRLRRTEAFKSLDPTEKGAVNYFLGMTMCKLFAAKLLDAPWALHLDAFGNQVGAVLSGRSRPDLIAETQAGEWVSLESKGRVSPPSADAKDKAKDQAERIVTVNGVSPKWHIGGISYFSGDALRFFWRDPTPDPRQRDKAININADEMVWKHYYAPVFNLIQARTSKGISTTGQYRQLMIEEADLTIEMHPDVLHLLLHEEWGGAKAKARYLKDDFQKEGFMPDGIRLIAGRSWQSPIMRG